MTTRKTPLQKQAEEPGMAGFAAARKLRQLAKNKLSKKDRDAYLRDLELRNAMLQIDGAITCLNRAYTSLAIAGEVDQLCADASALTKNLRVLYYTVGVAR